MGEPLRLLGIGIALVLTTALPWLASMLLTDIYTGLSVLALFIMVLHGDRVSTTEKSALFVFVAFSASTHSGTLAVLLGLCCLGLIAWPLLRQRVSGAGLLQGWLSLAAGAGMSAQPGSDSASRSQATALARDRGRRTGSETSI